MQSFRGVTVAGENRRHLLCFFCAQPRAIEQGQHWAELLGLVVDAPLSRLDVCVTEHALVIFHVRPVSPQAAGHGMPQIVEREVDNLGLPGRQLEPVPDVPPLPGPRAAPEYQIAGRKSSTTMSQEIVQPLIDRHEPLAPLLDRREIDHRHSR